MSLLTSLSDGLRSLFRKEQVSQDLDEELNGFLEMAAEQKMKQGMSRKEALRAVRLECGSLEVTKEVVRSAGWESFLETLWQLTGLFLTQRDKKRERELESIIPVSLISRGRGSPLLNADPDRFCSKRELPMQYDCLYPTSRGSLQPRFRLGCHGQGTDPSPLSEVLVRFDYWARLAA